MPLKLDSLPFDVLFFISQYLDIDDIVHLSLTCRQLTLLLQESTLCRRAVEAHVFFSHEASAIRDDRQDQPISWRSALLRIYHRRKAFANAAPVSASVIGYGSDFCQREGVLSYLTANRFIHVLELLPKRGARYTIDLSVIIRLIHAKEAAPHYKFSLMNYSDGVLVVRCELPASYERNWLLALQVDESMPDAQRFIAFYEAEAGSKLFVRHNRSYLYYGIHSGIGSHGHHEWQIRGLSLDPAKPLPHDIYPIQLEDFVGSDLGSTVVFEIHGEYFYGLSNQTSFDLEEVDWTSFYRCIRFPLCNPSRGALEVNANIYRRPHKEGPINDLWTDLSLQVDERTNELIIVEARREWLRGGSKQYRTFYTQRLKLSSSSDSDVLFPVDDPLTRVIDSSNHPRYAPPRHRKPGEAHPEHGSELVGQPNTFSFARTKFRGYDLSSSAFLDIVEDLECCPQSSTTPCLRLRIGSRRPAPIPDASLDMENRVNVCTLHPEAPEPETQFLTHHYRYSPIRLWPPDLASSSQLAGSTDSLHCPASEPHAILNPPRFPSHAPAMNISSCAGASTAHSSTNSSLASFGPAQPGTSSSSPLPVSTSSSSYPGPSFSPRHRHITASLSHFFLIYHIRFAKDGVSAPSGEGAIVCVAFDRHVKLDGSHKIWFRDQAPQHHADTVHGE